MPKLNTQREAVTVKLVTVEGGEVQVYTSLLANDMEKLVSIAGPDGKTGIIATLETVIKEWNLTGADDQPLPVTRENIGMLDARDVAELVKVIGGQDFLSQTVA